MNLNILLPGLLLFLSQGASAQLPDTTLPGVWKGTSICQIRNSPCHDEVVVYHISKGKKANEYTVFANKIVNGVEEEMGTISYILDEQQMELTGSYSKDDIWKLRLKGDKLEGTLHYKGVLYRVINIQKQK